MSIVTFYPPPPGHDVASALSSSPLSSPLPSPTLMHAHIACTRANATGSILLGCRMGPGSYMSALVASLVAIVAFTASEERVGMTVGVLAF